MTKKTQTTLISILIAANVTVIVMLFALGYFRLSSFIHAYGVDTDNDVIVKTLVSPDGRWKVRLHDIGSGAMAPDGYCANVVDLKGRVPTKNIYDDDFKYVDTIRWKNSHIIVVNSHEFDMRKNYYSIFHQPLNY